MVLEPETVVPSVAPRCSEGGRAVERAVPRQRNRPRSPDIPHGHYHEQSSHWPGSSCPSIGEAAVPPEARVGSARDEVRMAVANRPTAPVTRAGARPAGPPAPRRPAGDRRQVTLPATINSPATAAEGGATASRDGAGRRQLGGQAAAGRTSPARDLGDRDEVLRLGGGVHLARDRERTRQASDGCGAPVPSPSPQHRGLPFPGSAEPGPVPVPRRRELAAGDGAEHVRRPARQRQMPSAAAADRGRARPAHCRGVVRGTGRPLHTRHLQPGVARAAAGPERGRQRGGDRSPRRQHPGSQASASVAVRFSNGVVRALESAHLSVRAGGPDGPAGPLVLGPGRPGHGWSTRL